MTKCLPGKPKIIDLLALIDSDLNLLAIISTFQKEKSIHYIYFHKISKSVLFCEQKRLAKTTKTELNLVKRIISSFFLAKPRMNVNSGNLLSNH